MHDALLFNKEKNVIVIKFVSYTRNKNTPGLEENNHVQAGTVAVTPP